MLLSSEDNSSVHLHLTDEKEGDQDIALFSEETGKPQRYYNTQTGMPSRGELKSDALALLSPFSGTSI